MADIFISYSQADREWVGRLARLIETEGFSVWWDVKVLPGEEFGDLVVKEIATAKCVVVVWSQHSVKSDWVYGEADEARQSRKLVPVLKDEVQLPTAFRKIHTADLSEWDQATDSSEVAILLDAIRTRVQHVLNAANPTVSEAPVAGPPAAEDGHAASAREPPSGSFRAGLRKIFANIGQINKVPLRIIAVTTIVVEFIKYGSYFSNPAIDFWNLYWLVSEWAYAVIFAVFAFSKRTSFPLMVRMLLGVAAALNAELIAKLFIPEGPPPNGALLYLIAYASNFATLGLIAAVPSPRMAEQIRPYALVAIAYYLMLQASDSTLTTGADGIVWFLAGALQHALEVVMVCAAPFQYRRTADMERIAPILVGGAVLALLLVSLLFHH